MPIRLHFLMVFALALAGCGSGESKTAPESPLVQVVEVRPDGAAGVLRASGMVGYRREADLAFNAPGVIARLLVDSGDRVRAGQTLATLRRTSGGSNADEAALAAANAERDLARAERLFAEGFISQARLDDARLAVERSRASSALTAPADGVILNRFADPAQSVGAGTPVFAFGETGSGMVVRAPAPAGGAARINVGAAASVRVRELGDARRQGRVTRVGGGGDRATGAIEIEVAVANAPGLRSGMVAAVEIASAGNGGEAHFLAPTLSLLDARADQGVVFVVDAQGIARRRSVRTAGVTQDGVIVVEGLAAGERIVSAGAAYVRDGEPVRIAPGS